MSMYLIPYVGSPEAREQRAALRKRAAAKEANRLADELREQKKRQAVLAKAEAKAAALKTRASELEALQANCLRQPIQEAVDTERKPLTGHQIINLIIREVASFYGISVLDLVSHRRAIRYSRPRQIAMWIARYRTAYSYPQIGQKFNGRDHSTTLHAVHKIDALREADTLLDFQLEALLKRIPLPLEISDIENGCGETEKGGSEILLRGPNQGNEVVANNLIEGRSQ